VIPFGLVGVPMQAMFHNAAFIAEGVPVFDIRKKFGATDMLVSNAPKGVALAAVMGRKNVAAHARARQRGLRADAADGGVPRPCIPRSMRASSTGPAALKGGRVRRSPRSATTRKAGRSDASPDRGVRRERAPLSAAASDGDAGCAH